MMMIVIFNDHFAVLSTATLLMREEAAAVTIRGAACLAHVRLLTRMSVRVLLECTESLKSLAARLAQIIRFAGVPGQVSAKGRTYGKRSTAHVTYERLIARVNANVICQTRRRREATIARLAHVRLDAGMSSHVICEGRVAGIYLTADVTQIFTRNLLLRFVRSLMEDETSLAGADLSADVAGHGFSFWFVH